MLFLCHPLPYKPASVVIFIFCVLFSRILCGLCKLGSFFWIALMTILSQYTRSTMLSSQSWKVNVKTDVHYSALHSGKHWSFKSSLLSKKEVPSENQHYEVILIYLKVPRILMFLYSWAMEDCSSTCFSSALKQPPLLTKHDDD